MRITKDISSSATNDKLSAGACGTVIVHNREGFMSAGNITRVLKVKWGAQEWDFDSANMQYLVVNEH